MVMCKKRKSVQQNILKEVEKVKITEKRQRRMFHLLKIAKASLMAEQLMVYCHGAINLSNLIIQQYKNHSSIMKLSNQNRLDKDNQLVMLTLITCRIMHPSNYQVDEITKLESKLVVQLKDSAKDQGIIIHLLYQICRL